VSVAWRPVDSKGRSGSFDVVPEPNSSSLLVDAMPDEPQSRTYRRRGQERGPASQENRDHGNADPIDETGRQQAAEELTATEERARARFACEKYASIRGDTETAMVTTNDGGCGVG
jgi:hypothetical protein